MGEQIFFFHSTCWCKFKKVKRWTNTYTLPTIMVTTVLTFIGDELFSAHAAGNLKFLLLSPFFLQRFWDGLKKFWLVSSSNKSDPFQKPRRKEEEEKSGESVGCQFTFSFYPNRWTNSSGTYLRFPALGIISFSMERNMVHCNWPTCHMTRSSPLIHISRVQAVAVPDTHELQITKFKMAWFSWKSTRAHLYTPANPIRWLLICFQGDVDGGKRSARHLLHLPDKLLIKIQNSGSNHYTMLKQRGG